MSSLLSYTIAGITIRSLGLLILLTAGGYFLGWILSLVVKYFARRGSSAEEITWPIILAKAADGPIRVACLILFFWIGLSIIPIPSGGVKFFGVLNLILKATSIGLLMWFLLKATEGLKSRMMVHAVKTETKMDDMLVPIIVGIIRIVIVMVGVLLVLQNLGYSVTSLLAGLGLGGAAIALAAKDTISNFFGSLVVFLDKPFEIGDWVIINGVDGVVEEIRLRTTVIRTWDRSVVTLPNSQLTTANVNNYTRMTSRKMSFVLAVSYASKSTEIEYIVEEVKKYVDEHQEDFDGAGWIGFDDLGDFSLNISVTAYSRSTQKAIHMQVRERFLLECMRIVERSGTKFVYPTQTLEFTDATLNRLGHK